jgi:hypothetical protein
MPRRSTVNFELSATTLPVASTRMLPTTILV